MPIIVLKIPICLSSDVLYFSAFKDDVDAGDVWRGGGARWPKEEMLLLFLRAQLFMYVQLFIYNHV